eukprot:CAMPEP_0177663238 /NCGR_PEP_ID=MMETSP0447-20121125/19800_1 /TAXON_ID=0 /ORGANISM="Stygamoeba regulata, Strain BSH-02190019" /LENGTH=286 /DNA_ID=CAMNT_0019169023 /DNA_START=66 /DNA_END=926 /DNA_ORIENTATION=+
MEVFNSQNFPAMKLFSSISPLKAHDFPLDCRPFTTFKPAATDSPVAIDHEKRLIFGEQLTVVTYMQKQWLVGVQIASFLGRETFNMYRSMKIKKVRMQRASQEVVDYLTKVKALRCGTHSATLCLFEDAVNFMKNAIGKFGKRKQPNQLSEHNEQEVESTGEAKIIDKPSDAAAEAVPLKSQPTGLSILSGLCLAPANKLEYSSPSSSASSPCYESPMSSASLSPRETREAQTPKTMTLPAPFSCTMSPSETDAYSTIETPSRSSHRRKADPCNVHRSIKRVRVEV